MNNQIQKQQKQELLKSQVPTSTRHLLNSVIKGKALEIATSIREYQTGGLVQFDKVLSISMHGRIPNLTHVYGFEKVHEILIILLTSFSNSLNLIRPMSSDQIVECAHELVLTTEEDQLSIEDYVLFFKGAKEGRYGKILDRLDQQTIFQLLEEYRSERHRQYVRIKDERNKALKGTGATERTNQPDAISDHMSSLGNKISNLKEQLKFEKEVNRASRL